MCGREGWVRALGPPLAIRHLRAWIWLKDTSRYLLEQLVGGFMSD